MGIRRQSDDVNIRRDNFNCRVPNNAAVCMLLFPFNFNFSFSFRCVVIPVDLKTDDMMTSPVEIPVTY